MAKLEPTGFYTSPRKLATFDIECFRNYFLVMFKNHVTKKEVYYDMHEDNPVLNIAAVREILEAYRIISFNGNNYDMPIVTLALTGASCAELKDASDHIIQRNLKPWDFYEQYGLRRPNYDHIDLFEPSPGVRVGLKKYGGRMHSRTIQDLPLAHDALVKAHQRPIMVRYCGNDQDTTWDLYQAIKPEIEMRERMSDKYGIDLRSKSDAQVAETVIKNQVEVLTGRVLWKEERARKEAIKEARKEISDRIAAGEDPEVVRADVIVPDDISNRKVFTYKAPAFINFETDQMTDLLREIECAAFRLNPDNGKVLMPKFLEDRIIKLGGAELRMGIGGLHSSEQKQIEVASDVEGIYDRDVTSYYPYLILICALVPPKIGEIFLEIYRLIVEERVEAKAKSQAAKEALNEVEEQFWKVVADSFKILANGTFGKLGSSFSVLFAPNLLIQVTITGQLSILMLIERAVLAGYRPISANTDGVVFRVPRARKGHFNSVVMDWEWDTGLNTEEVEYRALYSRDVNNYIAVLAKPDKKTGAVVHKGKGVFTKPGLRKDPQHWICYSAVIEFLKNNTPLSETIRSSTDIRDFVQMRVAGDGGGVYDGKYLGKTVRWYMSTKSVGPITLLETGNKVAGTDGCMPCMTLPDEFPEDLDVNWYLQESHAILDDLGYDDTARPLNIDGRTGVTFARLPGKKNIHMVNIETMTAACGQKPVTRREPWIEVPSIPEGHRQCPSCRKNGIAVLLKLGLDINQMYEDEDSL